MMFDLDSFIYKHVVKRPKSMFINDIKLNETLLTERITDKSFLVIGGAGSIGSSFIKAILPFCPSELVIVDINENALTELTRDLRSDAVLSTCIPQDYRSYPMDYNSEAFAEMFKEHGCFDYVANFSAHKHVRSEKDIYSIHALLSNNVINARNLLNLLSEFPPLSYFCVSTDKAANPVNIMGASKLVMENLIFSYSNIMPVHTARFANVAFSNGSLPDGFMHRIAKHQPISAPSDIKRYFVSPEESGQICMLSAMLGKNRDIFFPKLDKAQMTTFDAIAIDLLNEHGFSPLYCKSDDEAITLCANLKSNDNNYPVHFSESDTSGEKPYEEFYTDKDSLDLNRYSSLGIIINKQIPDVLKLNELIDNLNKMLNSNSCTKEDIVKLLEEYLPSFKHIETGKNLDNKM